MRFITRHFYHIYNQGLDKRPLFLDDTDYKYFLFHLIQFNDKLPVSPLASYYIRKGIHSLEKQPKALLAATPKKPLVDIIAYTIMPNHFHLLLAQKQPLGISNFLRKIGTGYTHYYNRKYKRRGHLFQGRFRSREIKKEQLFNATLGFHTDPVKLFSRKKKERIAALVMAYPWSSAGAYVGEPVFPLAIPNIVPTIKEQMGTQGQKNYRKRLATALLDDFTWLLDNTTE